LSTRPYTAGMYELTVEAEFCAAHALVIAGVREPTHGHNFRVTVTLAGPVLDPDGMLVDFHAVERRLREILGPWQNADLNAAAPFGGPKGLNPSAEHIARTIAEGLEAGMTEVVGAGDRRSGADRPRVAAVRVTEAAGCAAVYRP
jgi:6-pyruvoyltetrahydropterin/6-carboxytetrahydropterin synthase